MEPVTKLTGREFNNRSVKLSDQIRSFFKSLGNKVFRSNLGDVELGEYGVGGVLNHRPINRAKAVSLAAVPDVIRSGRQIGYDLNWKGRGYESYIFAAPVTVNGTDVYVAAVVNKLPDNKFYLSEMVDSEGNYVRIEESPSGNSKNGLPMGLEDQQVRDYAGPEGLSRAGNPSTTSAEPTPLFNNSIPKSEPIVNTVSENTAEGSGAAQSGAQTAFDTYEDILARGSNAASDPLSAAVEGFRNSGTVTSKQAIDILNNSKALQTLREQVGLKLPDTASGRRNAIKEAVERFVQQQTAVDTAPQTDYDNVNGQGGVRNADTQGRPVYSGGNGRNTQSNSQRETAGSTENGRRNVQSGYEGRLYGENGQGALYTSDSEGRELTPEYAARLRETSVTDSGGAPLAVYHITDNMEFTTFSKGDTGFHFGSSAQALEHGRKRGYTKGRIFRAYLNIENPIQVSKDIMGWHPGGTALLLWSNGILTESEMQEVTKMYQMGDGYDSASAIRLREILGSKGYDGIAYPNGFEGEGMSYIAFYDDQIIKSEITPFGVDTADTAVESEESVSGIPAVDADSSVGSNAGYDGSTVGGALNNRLSKPQSRYVTAETEQGKNGQVRQETAAEPVPGTLEWMQELNDLGAGKSPSTDTADTQTIPSEDTGTPVKEYISMADFSNRESSVFRNVEYGDDATKSTIMHDVHEAMVAEGAVVRVSNTVTDSVEQAYPDLRSVKKKERTPILKNAMNKLKNDLRQFLNGFKNQSFEFEVNGKVLEATLYNTGINEVLAKVTKQKAGMLYSTEEIFRNAQYLYSTLDYDGDPNVYRWNYFYTPVQIGDETVGVRIAVRDMVRGTDGSTSESQIYNWGIKKDASLDGGSHGPKVASSDVSSDASNNNIAQTEPIVNTVSENTAEGSGATQSGAQTAFDTYEDILARGSNAASDPLSAAVEGFRNSGTVTDKQAIDILNNSKALQTLREQVGLELPDSSSGRRNAIKEAVERFAQQQTAVDTAPQTDYDNVNGQGGAANGAGQSVYTGGIQWNPQGNSQGKVTGSPADGSAYAGSGAQNGSLTARNRGAVYTADSEGRGLSVELVEKLKDTAIRDGKGVPLAVYHVTDNMDFTTFAKGDTGFHFGSTNQAVNHRKNRNYSRGRTFRAYLNIINPIYARHDIMGWTPKGTALYLWTEGVLTDAELYEINSLWKTGDGYDSASAIRLREILGSKGYDGIAYPNGFEGEGMSYMAFYDDQIIKSEITPFGVDTADTAVESEESVSGIPAVDADSSVGSNAGYDGSTVGDAQSRFERKQKTSRVYSNTYANAPSEAVRKVGEESKAADPNVDKYDVVTERESVYNAMLRTRNREDIDFEFDDLMSKTGWSGRR